MRTITMHSTVCGGALGLNWTEYIWSAKLTVYTKDEQMEVIELANHDHVALRDFAAIVHMKC